MCLASVQVPENTFTAGARTISSCRTSIELATTTTLRMVGGGMAGTAELTASAGRCDRQDRHVRVVEWLDDPSQQIVSTNRTLTLSKGTHYIHVYNTNNTDVYPLIRLATMARWLLLRSRTRPALLEPTFGRPHQAVPVRDSSPSN